MVLAQYSGNCGSFRDIALKASDGFTKIYPVFIVIIGYSITFIALAKVLQVLPVAIIYAIWSGLGITLVAVAGWFFFGEKLGVNEIIGIFLIIVGIVVLKGFSSDLN
ncbi:MAG: multidrug transporter [Burkholderiaceae bacterium]|nr:MAG: multidrug transporter [Burkholderiaceae bacterium]